ncbi:hypothetical protein DSECCO2_137180 [anaerobic digester metagenome]
MNKQPARFTAALLLSLMLTSCTPDTPGMTTPNATVSDTTASGTMASETTSPAAGPAQTHVTSSGSTADPVVPAADVTGITEVTNQYYDSLNRKDIATYNASVAKKLQMEETSESWQYMKKTLISEEDISLDFSKAKWQGSRIMVPVTHTITMSEDYIPSNIEPGENLIVTEIYYEKNSQGHFMISDWGHSIILKNRSNP